MTTHLPECFEKWQIPRKCNICDALRACEARERKRVISEVEELACGVTFYNLLDERFFFESLHAMKAEQVMNDEGSSGVTVLKCHHCQRPVFATRYSVLHLDWTPACRMSDTEL